MKRFLILTVLLLSFAYSQAQTIDFTGVSINTEHIKKVYERKSFVLGTLGVERFKSPLSGGWTGSFGIRYGMVWKFGFYVGAEMGFGGFPSTEGKRIYYNSPYYDIYTLVSGRRKDQRMTLNLGGLLRLNPNWNLSVGTGVAFFNTVVEQQNKEWLNYEDSDETGILAEVGVIYHLNRISLMANISHVFVSGYRPIRASIGVGYNF